jgi:hypothetical protein
MTYDEINAKRKKVRDEIDSLNKQGHSVSRHSDNNAERLLHSLTRVSTVKAVKFPSALLKKYKKVIAEMEKAEEASRLEWDSISSRIRFLQHEEEVLDKCLLRACVCSCSKK